MSNIPPWLPRERSKAQGNHVSGSQAYTPNTELEPIDAKAWEELGKE